MSGALKAFVRKDAEGNDRRYLSCTASSSIKDLHDDEFTPECVEKMATSALQKQMTIFLNHQYKVPEDVFGSTTASKSIVRLDADGTPVTDMDLEMLLNETNPRAVSTYDAVEAGVKLGVSVGALIRNWHPRDPNDTWGWDGMVIDDVELLEASIVGIPANPRSWVQNAVKSLRDAVKAANDEDDDPETVGTKLLTQMVEDGALLIQEGAAVKDADEVLDPDPISDDEKDGDPEAALEGEGDTNKEAPEATTDDQQPPSDGAANGEEVSETTLSAPATDAVTNDAALKGLDVLVAGYKEKLAALQGQLTTVTQERDQALEALKTAMTIVDQIASLPLGRKTAFREATSTLKERFGGVYDDAFLKFLERTPDHDA
jgi:phage head maturation protease